MARTPDKKVDVKKSLSLSRKIPAKMKEKIRPYLQTSSRYNRGAIYGLRKPRGMGKISKKLRGVSFGADKNGFFEKLTLLNQQDN